MFGVLKKIFWSKNYFFDYTKKYVAQKSTKKRTTKRTSTQKSTFTQKRIFFIQTITIIKKKVFTFKSAYFLAQPNLQQSSASDKLYKK